MTKTTNRLINETSPYLLQHSNNPVDWYPWGPEAINTAKQLNKPILLSIGYSACHWCHVMEKESFENDHIASIMNKNFVCIKVDREERPDLDSIYMTAVQILSGQGGWPMTVFLTPDCKPFYGGTYFPPEDRQGMPGFPKVLETISNAYISNRKDIENQTENLVGHIEQINLGTNNGETLNINLLHQAYNGIEKQFDHQFGGIGNQPKFPQPMIYEYLLRQYVQFGTPEALEITELTLDQMAKGGIYDQIGGGFHRYSTDNLWLVPHFEKMLYDNALLVKLYLHAYQITGKLLYRKVVEETLTYILREMTDESGGFYSSQDADSESIEGKFFIWKPQEIIDVLGKTEAEIVNSYYGVTESGNFEESNILHISSNESSLAEKYNLTTQNLQDIVDQSKLKLLAAREHRIRPERDDKILTGWNGLMLAAFAEAGSILNRKDYVDIARKNATFIINNLHQNDRILRTYKDGLAKLNGYLEDYSFLISGLLSLHETTFEEKWLTEAIRLNESMINLFWDKGKECFYDTGNDHEQLVVRPRDLSDNAIPSGNSMATEILIRISIITGNTKLNDMAKKCLQSAKDLFVRFPTGAGQWLCSLDFFLSKPQEIVIIGNRDDSATEKLVTEIYRNYIPNRIVVGQKTENNLLKGLPVFKGRESIKGNPTAYLCENYVCRLPTTIAQELANQLSANQSN